MTTAPSARSATTWRSSRPWSDATRRLPSASSASTRCGLASTSRSTSTSTETDPQNLEREETMADTALKERQKPEATADALGQKTRDLDATPTHESEPE